MKSELHNHFSVAMIYDEQISKSTMVDHAIQKCIDTPKLEVQG